MSFTAPDMPPADETVSEPVPAPVVETPDPTPVAVEAPQEPAPQPVQPVAPVQPIRVDGTNRRSDEDGLEGGFVEIVSGDYVGVVGSFLSVVKYDTTTGYPETILVRARDHAGDHDLVSVAYADCRPVLGYQGGR